jgi:hypothetical protein
MFFDPLQQMGIVQVDLALRLPKPEKIDRPDDRDD